MADLFLYAVEAPSYLCFFLQAFLVLLVDPKILLFFQLDIGLVLFDLSLQSFQLFPLDFFGFDELFESEIVLYFCI